MSEQGWQVLVVDDHPIVCEGVKRIVLQRKNVSCTGVSDAETLEKLLDKVFDMYIIDLEFPGIDSRKLVSCLRKYAPRCRILIYSMHDEPWVASRLSDLCIDGAVSKNSDVSELCRAVDILLEGGTYFDRFFLPARQKKNCLADETHVVVPELSSREKEVLVCLSQGMSTSETAERLFISPNTVKTHRKHLMEKLEAKNVAELIAKWKRCPL